MKKNFFQNLFLFTLGIIFSLLILEIVLRATNTVKLQDDNLVNDDYLGYKIKPNLDTIMYTPEKVGFHVKTTTLGFDGIWFRDDGTSGSPYAIVLGDSFTFALGVNESSMWTKILGNDFNAKFVNMGVWGYSTIAEERTMEKYGLKMKPKLVILGFAVNDFSDSYNFYQDVIAPSKPASDFLRDNVAVYRFLWEKLGELKHDTEIINYSDGNLTFLFWPQPALKNISPKFEKVIVGESYAKASILKMKKLADENGAKFIIALLPAKEQVYWDIVKKYISNPEDYTYDYPLDSIRSFCSDNNLNCVDVRPIFNEHALKHEQLFFPVDSHYNEAGNKLVAEALYKYFQNTTLN